MPEHEPIGGPHVFPPTPPTETTRPPEEVLLHRRHAVTFFWKVLTAVAIAAVIGIGGFFAGVRRGTSQPAETVELSGKNALQADTLPSTATSNPARIFSFSQGLGLLVVQEGQPFTYEIDAPDATACQLVSPAASGAATNTKMTIEPGHPWYPRPGRPVIFRAFCTNGVRSVGDSAVVVLGGIRGMP